MLNNIRATDASRPDERRFPDVPTNTRFVAEYATRIEYGRHVVYDGCTTTRSGLFTQAMLDTLQHDTLDRATSHRLRSLAKGVADRQPALFEPAKRGATILSLLHEDAAERDPEFASWMRSNRDQLLRMVQLFSFSSAEGATSVVFNHDGDIESRHALQFWARKERINQRDPIAMAELANTPEATLVERSLAADYARAAKCACAYVSLANEIREQAPFQARVPELEANMRRTRDMPSIPDYTATDVDEVMRAAGFEPRTFSSGDEEG